MSRYNDILRGPELAAAYQEMLQWRAKTRQEKRTLYQQVAKPANARVNARRVKVYIHPFSSVQMDMVLETRAPAAAQTGANNDVAQKARGMVQTLVLDEPPAAAGTKTIRIPKFKFAKIILSDRDNATAGVVGNSRITGLPYKKYRTFNSSCPFGKDETRSSFALALAYIRGRPEYQTFITPEGDNIRIVPELSALSS